MSVMTLPGALRVMEPMPDFDLADVRTRVAKEHPDWDEQRLAAAELSYRNYLTRCKASPPSMSLSPGRDADEFWHAHILHTVQYHRDCQRYFGYYLHHRPFGDDHPRADNAICEDECFNCGCKDMRPYFGDARSETALVTCGRHAVAADCGTCNETRLCNSCRDWNSSRAFATCSKAQPFALSGCSDSCSSENEQVHRRYDGILVLH